MPEHKRPPVIILIIPLMIGILSLNRVMNSQSYETYRGVDVIQLLGSGACFGATLVALVTMIRRRRE